MAAPVFIFDYDPSWPAAFEAERARLGAALGIDLVAIEHVGSTSVPGLAAKPIVDIMGGVARLEGTAAWGDVLHALGYEFQPEALTHLPDDRLFLKRTTGTPAVNLHLTEHGGAFWQEKLLFRDYLRAHDEVAREYEALKRALAPRFLDVPFTYSVAKTDFIRATLDRARQTSP